MMFLWIPGIAIAIVVAYIVVLKVIEHMYRY